jgi:very-short-patch-repair endonuclease
VPSAEYPLPTDDLEGLVDRAWEDVRMILEIDGRAWHAREAAMARDRARDRAAAAGGWLTLRVLDSEVAQDPAGVLRDLEAAYRSRVALLMP